MQFRSVVGSALGSQVADYCTLAYSALASFRMGTSGSASFQRARKAVTSCYCGKPTLRTNPANRGSERKGSSKKSVFNLSSPESRS